MSIASGDATPDEALIAPAAEFAFTEQPSHPRGHVSLLLHWVLAGAISPVEASPAAEAPPVVETSPTPTPEDAAPPAAPETTPPAAETTPPPAAETTPPAAPEATGSSTSETAPPAGPPGGYWSLAEQHERSREPLDGDDELTIGSVLFSLGILRAGAGVVTILMAGNSELCPLTQPRGCSGLRNYGWAGVAEGGLMFGTGLTYMIIGATRRQRHRRWERGEPLGGAGGRLNVVDVGPWLIPRAAGGVSQARSLAGAGLRLQLQF